MGDGAGDQISLLTQFTQLVLRRVDAELLLAATQTIKITGPQAGGDTQTFARGDITNPLINRRTGFTALAQVLGS